MLSATTKEWNRLRKEEERDVLQHKKRSFDMLGSETSQQETIKDTFTNSINPEQLSCITNISTCLVTLVL